MRRMRPPRALWLAAACAALCSLSTPAWAAPTPKDKAEAATLAVEGRAALQKQQFDDAIKAFRRADELDPTLTAKLDLARALAGAGKLVEASTTLHAIDGAPGDTYFDKQAKDEAKKLLGEVEARIPWLQVTVVGPKPEEAKVTIDGKEVDVSGEVPLDPGEHQVKVEAKGWKPGEAKATLADAAHDEVKVELEREEPAAPPPPPPQPLAPPPPKPKLPSTALVAFGVGGAGVAIGSVFGVLAFLGTSDVEDRCKGKTCPPSARRDLDAALLNGNISTVAFAVGGVGLATGVVLLVTAPRPAPQPAPQTGARQPAPRGWVQPYVGLGQAGVVGAF